jgi:hypothetical protein
VFLVRGLKHGECASCGKEADCYLAECQKGTFSGLLCPRDFLRQVKMRNGNGRVPEAAPSFPHAESKA